MAEKSRKRYATEVLRYTEWARERKHSATSLVDLDESLAAYLNVTFVAKAGVGKDSAAMLLSAIPYFVPRAKGKLPNAHQALRGWRAIKPTLSWPPLTWTLSVAIAVQMVRLGRRDMAIAALLSFDSMLRVGELTRLKVGDIVFAGREDPRFDPDLPTSGMRIRRAKTGREQYTTIDILEVRQLLEEHVRDRDRRAALFDFNSAQFRQFFERVCDQLGLPPVYVPHSFRHGGATRMHLLGKPMDSVMIKGRWSERKSARRYIQSGRALLASIRIPPDVYRAGRIFCRDVIRAFRLAQRL